MTTITDTTSGLVEPSHRIDLAALMARWRAIKAANGVSLIDAIGMKQDQIVSEVLDVAQEDLLEALLVAPISTDAEAWALVELTSELGRSLDGCRRSDHAEIRLLRKVVDFLETSDESPFETPATNLTN